MVKSRNREQGQCRRVSRTYLPGGWGHVCSRLFPGRFSEALPVWKSAHERSSLNMTEALHRKPASPALCRSAATRFILGLLFIAAVSCPVSAQLTPQGAALKRAADLLKCVRDCIETGPGPTTVRQLQEHVEGCPYGMPPGGNTNQCLSEGTTRVGGRDLPTWNVGTPNDIVVADNLGSNGTHYFGDIYGDSTASDVALAAVLLHESSHSLYDSYVGGWVDETVNGQTVSVYHWRDPINDRKAWLEGEIRASNYEIAFLRSMLGDMSCLWLCLVPGLSAAGRAAIQDRIDQMESYRDGFQQQLDAM